MIGSSTLAYVVPFGVFIALLACSKIVPIPALLMQSAFVAISAAATVLAAHRILRDPKSMRLRNLTGSLLVGVAVFVIWIAPDRLFPVYRHFWLFDNPIIGRVQPGVAPGGVAVLWLRSLRAAAIVPVVEELFWRGWLMRWLISADFESVPLGTWSAFSFWIVALLFASEHGPYWDVGLLAGVIYNWWMLRTRSLGDLMLAHGITNACLSAYVVFAKEWRYW